MRKKGFTLIELIVVMAIISILVLLGVPKYKSYTEEARITKLTVEAKELEKASQQYYIKNQDWPRLSDEPYTVDEVKEFSNKIYNSTGKVVELEDGNYYDIDYSKLSNYISKPTNFENYILQNPVGNVYSLYDLTEQAQKRITNVDGSKEEIPEKVYSPESYFIISAIGEISASEELKALPFPVDLIIPREINGIEVKRTAMDGFREMKNIRSVDFPESLEVIGNYTFLNASSLESIQLPYNLKSIAALAFAGCSNLKEIIIPESVTNLGIQLLQNCTSLEKVVLPSTLTKLSHTMFSGCVNLKNITIPEGVTEIGHDAFAKCTSLSVLEIPKSVMKIDGYAFDKWTSAQKIIFKGRTTTEGMTLGISWNSGSGKIEFQP